MQLIGINSASEHALGQMKMFVYLRSKYSLSGKIWTRKMTRA